MVGLAYDFDLFEDLDFCHFCFIFMVVLVVGLALALRHLGFHFGKGRKGGFVTCQSLKYHDFMSRTILDFVYWPYLRARIIQIIYLDSLNDVSKTQSRLRWHV